MSRLRTLPLRSRLTVVALLPVLGMLAFALGISTRRASDADEARKASDTAEFVRHLSTIGGGALRQRVLLIGGGALDSVGVPLLASRFETEADRWATVVLDEFAELVAHAHSDQISADELDELGELVGRIATAESVDGATIADVTMSAMAASGSDTLLPDQLELARRAEAFAVRSIAGAGVDSSSLTSIVRLTEVSSVAFDETIFVLVNVFAASGSVPEGDPSDLVGALELVEHAVAQEVLLESVSEQLAPEQAAEIDAFLTSPVNVQWEALRRRALEVAGVEVDGETNGDAIQGAYTAEIRMNELTDVVDVAAASIVDDFDRRRADAERASSLAAVLSMLVTAVTAIALIFAIRSITRPLTRIERRARALREGQLDEEPLPRDGPVETVVLADAMNDVTEVLRLVGAQAAALAAGDTTATVLDDDVPGELGASLQRSVRRLSDTTRRLRASESLFRSVIDAAVDAIWLIDSHGSIVSANTSAAQMFDGTPSDFVGARPNELFPPRVVEAIAGSESTIDLGEAMFSVREGGIPVLVSLRRVDLNERQWTILFARDISERKRFEAALEAQATHDQLTGLPNRTSLLARMEHEIAQLDDGRGAHHRGFALLFCDLDQFKMVNDAMGHRVGDDLLVEVGRRLGEHTRRIDTVARLGGDEFVVLLSDLHSPTVALAMADRLLRTVGEPVTIDDAEFVIGVSIGVLWADEPGDDPHDLLRKADLAMYRAKERGRNRVELFDDRLQRDVEERSELERGLRQAFDRDELSVALQPIVDLSSGAVVGAECLCRWNRGGRQEVPPEVFIPIAEDVGLIGRIGRFVLDEACRLLADLTIDGGDDFWLSVNISGRHLVSGDLAVDVALATARWAVDPSRLVIELTESFLFDDLDQAVEQLRDVAELGVGVSIDDFGTGYSSLSYLFELPVTSVKIDRSFIAQLGRGADQKSIASVVVSLADALGLRTVAEGIEHESQADHLAGLGCQLGQGFHLGRPMTPAAFGAHLAASRATVDADVSSW